MPRFRAIIFDLLTALLDSWTLWGEIAGDGGLGAQWRRRSLEPLYASGEYRPCRAIIVEAAGEEFADELLRRWDELVTNTSEVARRAGTTASVLQLRAARLWRSLRASIRYRGWCAETAH